MTFGLILPSNLARSLWCHGHVGIRWSPGWWKSIEIHCYSNSYGEWFMKMYRLRLPSHCSISRFCASHWHVLFCFPSNILGGSPRRWWSLVASQAHFLSYMISNFVGLRPGAADVEFCIHSRWCLCGPNWNESQTLVSSSSANNTCILNMTHRTFI